MKKINTLLKYDLSNLNASELEVYKKEFTKNWNLFALSNFDYMIKDNSLVFVEEWNKWGWTCVKENSITL